MLFLLWWCFDDHLAAAVNAPGLGQLDWWVVLLASFCLTAVTTSRS